MPDHQLRIRVRGRFDALTPEQRDGLLREAALHDPLRAAFTDEGCVSYDLDARPFFAFRVSASVRDEAAVPDAVRRAEEAAGRWAAQRGLSWVHVASHVENLTTAPLGKRQRKRLSAAGG
jgi:hypothetical protein